MFWYTGLQVAHKLCASSHAFSCTQNFDRTDAVVCVEHRARSQLRAGMSAVKDH